MNPHNLNPNPDPNLHPDFQTNMLVFVAARRRSALCSPPSFPVPSPLENWGENKLILNLGSANYSLARIPSAPLEIAVKGRLDGGRKVSGWADGQSWSVKLSQTSVEKG
jgi:hypothetical protein